jgi:hypothetical protein
MSPDGGLRTGGDALARRVARALDALEPAFLRVIADPAASFEHALHVVVMDPAAAPARTSFEDAILVERSFGEPDRWQADYAHYARAKARVAWREGVTTSTLVEDAPARLRRGDLVVAGAVCRHGLVAAASGAQPWYDEACAAMAIELVNAHLRDAVSAARGRDGVWA